jgi:methyltransferase (TIGR00027 family)
MLEAQPSQTAMATAFLRAVHGYIDDPPPILDDRPAFELLPSYQRRFIMRLGALSSRWQKFYRQKYDPFTNMRTHVVVRARYAEDALTRARVSGVTRYVILAAGLDTFALRQAAPCIDIVEIDHPATQRWKRELLADRDIAEPPEVSFLPVDFESESLADRWIDNPQPDFISWLGVTYYLTEDAIVNTLTFLATHTAPGSQIVLDYWSSTPATDSGSQLLLSTRFAVALLSEPMRSFFDPQEIEALAIAAGWQIAEQCPPQAQARRYLANREDRLMLPPFAHLLHLKR